MADPNMTDNDSNNSNDTLQRDQAEVDGGSGRQREQSGMDKDRQDKSAIGGKSKSDENAKDKNRSDFEKNRGGEPSRQS